METKPRGRRAGHAPARTAAAWLVGGSPWARRRMGLSARGARLDRPAHPSPSRTNELRPNEKPTHHSHKTDVMTLEVPRHADLRARPDRCPCLRRRHGKQHGLLLSNLRVSSDPQEGRGAPAPLCPQGRRVLRRRVVSLVRRLGMAPPLAGAFPQGEPGDHPDARRGPPPGRRADRDDGR